MSNSEFLQFIREEVKRRERADLKNKLKNNYYIKEE